MTAVSPPAPPETAPPGPAGVAPAGHRADVDHAGPSKLGAWVSRVDEVLVAALVVLAVAPFRELFVSARVLVLATGVVALCLVVNVAAQRLSAAVAMSIALATAAAYVVVAVYRVPFDDERSLGSVWSGVGGSWADLLTATTPAGTTPQLVSLPVVLAWLAAEAGLTISLRTRSASGPVVPPLAAFAIGLLFTGDQGLVPVPLIGALIVVSLVVVLVRANLFAASATAATRVEGYGFDVHRRSLPTGQLRLGGVLLLVVGAGAVAAGRALPITSEEQRLDLHSRYDPPLEVSDALSPLSTLRSSLNSTDETPLFTVSFTGIPAGVSLDRVRTAVLESYDGTVWGTGATFARAGTEIPPGEPVGVPTVPIVQHYEVAEGYRGAFLPSLDRPTLVGGSDLGFDRASGMLIRATADGDELAYDVTSQVPFVTDADTARAVAGNSPAYSPLSLAPAGGWTTEIRQFADSRPAAGSRIEQLRALESTFRSQVFGYDTEARPGHSLGVLGGFLTAQAGTDGVDSARVGYAEQFAAAFAVIARVDGLPSRVVVGYRVDPAAAAAGQTIAVRERDIDAWAEVHFNGVGWVQFDPTDETPRQPEEQPPPPQTTVVPIDTPEPDAPPPSTLPAVPDDEADGDGPARAGGGVPIAAIVVPLVLLALPVSVVLAKRGLRKRRRTGGDPAQQVIGAWREARDRLGEYGQRPPRGATITEAAERTTVALAPPLRQMAPILDRTLYAAAAPDEDMAKAAWSAEASLTRAVRDESNLRRRVRAALDPRPLVDALARKRR